MAIVQGVVEEELERLRRSEQAYMKKIHDLPKGSICWRKISGKVYPYLRYRDHGKIVEQYLKQQSSEDMDRLQIQIVQRKKLEGELKKIRHEISAAMKMLYGRQREKSEQHVDPMLMQ